MGGRTFRRAHLTPSPTSHLHIPRLPRAPFPTHRPPPASPFAFPPASPSSAKLTSSFAAAAPISDGARGSSSTYPAPFACSSRALPLASPFRGARPLARPFARPAFLLAPFCGPDSNDASGSTSAPGLAGCSSDSAPRTWGGCPTLSPANYPF